MTIVKRTLTALRLRGIITILALTCVARGPECLGHVEFRQADEGPSDVSIVPGERVGPLRLGDSMERAVELFGTERQITNFSGSRFGECEFQEAKWVSRGEGGGGVSVYATSSGIYQIWVNDLSSITRTGIRRGSPAVKIRVRHAQLEAFVLRNSDPGFKGGKRKDALRRDLVYWVSRQDGIAFELGFNHETLSRDVRNIIVFAPGSDFVPMGCERLLAPQGWERMPEVTEEPGNIGEDRLPSRYPT